MDTYRQDKWKVWTPLFFSLVLIAGMILGFNLRDSLRNKRDITTVFERNDRLEEVIDLVKNKYVDTVNSDLLYKNAITGILKSLDPHTIYIPAEELQGINEDMEGSFSGIGVEFSIFRDTIEVTSVIDKGPAGNAGVEIGDQLIKVGDSLVAGNNITSERIISLLRGKESSNVFVTLRRADGAMKQMPITRGEIPIYSIDATLMAGPATGFIKINRFSATTYDEFKKAVKALQDQGAKEFIIDLRDNPGGYLDAATSIADEFLNDNKLIVYTKGVHTPRTEYKAGDKGRLENVRMAVLMDESSASASEIFAGAIQDWDRGLIIGRRSFGKGLVQEQYDLPDGSGLRLTIAKYYTPSGRCIQRSFAKGREAYEADYERRFEDGELTGADTVASSDDTTTYYTAGHRKVYGGGGIKPDIFVPYDTARLSTHLLSMIFSDEFKAAIWNYFRSNRSKLHYNTIGDYINTFDDEGKIVANYMALLKPDAMGIAEKELAKKGESSYFRMQAKAQLARFLFRDNGYFAVNIKSDDVVARALAVLSSPEYLQLISGK